MHSVISTQTDLSTLISLDEAKRQCRLMPTFTLDDDDLYHLIDTCTNLAQVYTKRLLSPGTVIAESDEYRTLIQLPWSRATSITSVVLDGVESTDYTFSTITQVLRVTKRYSNIVITYEAGYDVLPSNIKHGILMMISTWYNNREDYVQGMTLEKIPMSSLRILDSVRYFSV